MDRIVAAMTALDGERRTLHRCTNSNTGTEYCAITGIDDTRWLASWNPRGGSFILTRDELYVLVAFQDGDGAAEVCAALALVAAGRQNEVVVNAPARLVAAIGGMRCWNDDAGSKRKSGAARSG
ncbi:Hypothetical protein UVM_LOCUS17 [uncultured virus]|nr:Hypothetical protein UVM_LOCUS17 [uncultured virus]